MKIIDHRKLVMALFAMGVCVVLCIYYFGFLCRDRDGRKPSSSLREEAPDLRVAERSGLILAEKDQNPSLPHVPQQTALQKLGEVREESSSDEEWKRAGIIKDRSTRISAELAALAVALEQYRGTFGVFPQGDSFAVMKALTGSNPKQMSFLAWRKESIGARGELLDPWGVPYQIKINHPKNEVEIRSAGSNQKFGDWDDVVELAPGK